MGHRGKGEEPATGGLYSTIKHMNSVYKNKKKQFINAICCNDIRSLLSMAEWDYEETDLSDISISSKSDGRIRG